MKRLLVLAAAAALVSSPACSSDDGRVGVTEVADFTVDAGRDQRAGRRAHVRHHERRRTDARVRDLQDRSRPRRPPAGDDGDVDEEGEGVEHIDEIEDITGGSHPVAHGDAGCRELRVHLQPPRPLPAGDARGVHRQLTAYHADELRLGILGTPWSRAASRPTSSASTTRPSRSDPTSSSDRYRCASARASRGRSWDRTVRASPRCWISRAASGTPRRVRSRSSVAASARWTSARSERGSGSWGTMSRRRSRPRFRCATWS